MAEMERWIGVIVSQLYHYSHLVNCQSRVRVAIDG